MGSVETIMSVGIDVGTSTSHLVFSRLTVANLASAVTVPRLEIIDKQIIYRSPIYTTPLIDPVTIDASALAQIISEEYRQAGITPEDVRTGAVIITGETARADNADQVLEAVSELAGDFVVSTAGPHLESVLAARGTGLDEASKLDGSIMANLDIGGGTTNIAAYRFGQLLATTCLDLGGRLVRVEAGQITHITAGITRLAAAAGIPISVGERANPERLAALSRLMAKHLAMAVGLLPRDAAHKDLYTNHGNPLPKDLIPAELSFSGGVADLIDDPGADPFRYGDIGPLLGRAIAEEPAFAQVRRRRGAETIGATVVGAGVHTTELSGSTIDYAKDILPLRNVPIVTLPDGVEEDPQHLVQAIAEAITALHPEDPTATVALSLRGHGLSSFHAVTQLSDAIMVGAKPILDGPQPLVIVLEADRAKVLGQTIGARRGRFGDVVCIDSVATAGGDYIDIGRPVGLGRAVPVVVKTLVFNTKQQT